MRSLADRIEQYIRILIERSETQEVEIQRIELAETFQCVPSQITYVLATRFTVADGFVTESKRGGKGFVRIKRVRGGKTTDLQGLSQLQWEKILNDLLKRGYLTVREVVLLKAITHRDVLGLIPEERDFIRAKMMRMVINLLEVDHHVL